MPSLVQAIKTLISKRDAVIVEQPSFLWQVVKSIKQNCIPSQLVQLMQDKSHAEIIFIASILAAVLLFVVVLPMHEAFLSDARDLNELRNKAFLRSNSGSVRTAHSSSSSQGSMETIEESEEEYITDHDDEEEENDNGVFTEHSFVRDMETVQDILNKEPSAQDNALNKSVAMTTEVNDHEVGNDDDSDATPDDETNDVMLETPTSSPPATPDRIKPIAVLPIPILASELAKMSPYDSIRRPRGITRTLSSKLGSKRLFGRKYSSSSSAAAIITFPSEGSC
jgi:hypothetical protein